MYSAALKGFHARLSAPARDLLARDAAVASITPNAPVQAMAQTLPTGVNRVEADLSSSYVSGGAVSTPVAVVDSGIASLPDLNVRPGVNCTATLSTEDVWGHGTHVAGIVGAKNNTEGVVGTAPGAPLHPVKVLDDNGSGSDATVLCGLEWLATAGPVNGIKVANMSIGVTGTTYDTRNCTTTIDPLHVAVCSVTNAGILIVASAGNNGGHIESNKPAQYAEVLTVAAMTDFDGAPGARGKAPAGCGSDSGTDDTAPFWSAYGIEGGSESHLVAAPGVCIPSYTPSGSVVLRSGTSSAAPHTAGTVAACLHAGTCSGTPAQLLTSVRGKAAVQPSSYGYTGDPHTNTGSTTRGYLLYAGDY